MAIATITRSDKKRMFADMNLTNQRSLSTSDIR